VLLIGTYAETDSPRFGFSGTGFVVGDGNLAVTNAHVLPPPSRIDGVDRKLVVQVPGARGQWSMRGCTVLTLDRPHDLALLRFDGPAAPALQLAQPEQVREGLEVALIGFPLGNALGFAPVTHRAMISSIVPIAQPQAGAQGLNESAVRRLREGPFEVLQLDGTAYPGNSGGPVLDAESGLVVGVVNMVLVKGAKESALSHPSGISYAIPSRLLARMLPP
jgi:S1-C subfamily serine protease